jgi:hypothetical protein
MKYELELESNGTKWNWNQMELKPIGIGTNWNLFLRTRGHLLNGWREMKNIQSQTDRIAKWDHF